jgi:hypothetical protein
MVTMNTIQLPSNFISLLSAQPETGMGYQIVNIILKNGRKLTRHKVLNSELLILNKDENIHKEDIAVVELEK